MTDAEMKEHKEMIEKGFELLTEHVEDMLEHHKVMPASISIPYNDEESGRWIRLTLEMSRVKDIDPEEIYPEEEKDLSFLGKEL